MTPDETRRRLERDARYETGLANLIECLTHGHVEGWVLTGLSGLNGMGGPVIMDGEPAMVRVSGLNGMGGPVIMDGEPAMVRVSLCPRCGLVFWWRDRAAEVGRRAEIEQQIAREATDSETRRVVQENQRIVGPAYRPYGGG